MIKLITSDLNVRYFSGFTGSIAMLIIDGKKRTLFVDGRYTNQAKAEVKPGIKIVTIPLTSSFYKASIEYLKKIKAKNIGYEDDKVSSEAFCLLKRGLPGAVFSSISQELREERMLKTPDEIRDMKHAAKIADAVFDCVVRMVRSGISEKDIAAEIDYLIRVLGGDLFAFETLVSSGANTAFTHGKPKNKVLKKGDLVLIDFGVRYNGYNSDMTRMLSIGAPSPRHRKLFDAVLKAQLAALSKVRAGVPASEIDKAARDVLKKEKLDKYFNHATGHGVGLAVHEGPRISMESRDVLKNGMVITIEPGAYIKGFAGVRIEDMVLVKKNGYEILTKTPKKLIVI
jgi:Xaa-Pro aminopeptidase